jgi:hypothetical protein
LSADIGPGFSFAVNDLEQPHTTVDARQIHDAKLESALRGAAPRLPLGREQTRMAIRVGFLGVAPAHV